MIDELGRDDLRIVKLAMPDNRSIERFKDALRKDVEKLYGLHPGTLDISSEGYKQYMNNIYGARALGKETKMAIFDRNEKKNTMTE